MVKWPSQPDAWRHETAGVGSRPGEQRWESVFLVQTVVRSSGPTASLERRPEAEPQREVGRRGSSQGEGRGRRELGGPGVWGILEAGEPICFVSVAVGRQVG